MLLHPLTLDFKHPKLEELYQERRRGALPAWDRSALRVHLGLHTVYNVVSILFWISSGRLDAAFFAGIATYTSLLLGHGLLLRRLTAERYLGLRSPLVVVLRLAFCVLFPACSRGLMHAGGGYAALPDPAAIASASATSTAAAATAAGAPWHLLITSGVFHQFFMALALPLPFPLHAAVQVCANVVMNLKCNQAACDGVAARAVTPLVTRSWRGLSRLRVIVGALLPYGGDSGGGGASFRASSAPSGSIVASVWRALTSSFGGGGGGEEAAAAAAAAAVAAPSVCPCWAVVSFLQVFVAVGLTSAVVYGLERGSRMAFMNQYHRQQHRANPEQVPPRLPRLPTDQLQTACQVLLLLLLGLAWWELLLLTRAALAPLPATSDALASSASASVLAAAAAAAYAAASGGASSAA